ncbi:MAG: hypothetical protein QM696_00545 [Steroidobacteraceae bacterium]
MAERDELGIRQEALFTLWALRTYNAEYLPREQRLRLLAHGFELADAGHALPVFLQFSESLARATHRRIHWHEPRCCRLSDGELLVLQALAQCQCRGGECPQWRQLLGAAAGSELQHWGCEWLRALSDEGICFPTPAELVEGLAPLENLISFQPERQQRRI